MAGRTLRKPPKISKQLLADLSKPVAKFLDDMQLWALDFYGAMESINKERDSDAINPSLPTALPILPLSQLTGTTFRAGGEPGLVFVPDYPGGGAIAYRDGSLWRVLVAPIVGLTTAVSAGTTSATLSDIPNMAVALKAGVAYQVQAFVHYRSTTATGGLALALTWPSATFANFDISIPANTTGLGRSYAGTVTASAASIVAPSTPAGNVNQLAIIAGRIKLVADGTLQVQHASEDGASTITIRDGSTLVATPYG